MKNTMIKERGEGGELKIKHEANFSEFENLQKDYQHLESEKDAMVLSVTISEGEKKDFERKISELEARKYAATRQMGEIRIRVEVMEEQNKMLEDQLQTDNESQLGITPFCDQAFLIRRNIHQVQLKLIE